MRCVDPVMTEGKVRSMRHDWPRYGLSGSTLDAMCRSRYDRRKSLLDAARLAPLWPKWKHT
jgi:hypothetical protein